MVVDTICEFIELSDEKQTALISNSIETAQSFSVRKAALSEWYMFSNLLK